MANVVAKAGNVTTLSTFMTTPIIKKKIVEMVGALDAPRFVSSVISAYAANPVLSECSNSSIFNAALLGESLKLSPSPQLGQFFMVPYKNKKADVAEAQFQLGYKGYIQLAIRSGQYKKLNVLAIKDGELVKWDALSEDIVVDLINDERAREQAATIGYYAMFEYINGFKKAIYWSKEKMLSHADKYSAAFSADGYTKNINIKGKKTQVQIVSFADYEAGKYNKDDEWLYSSFWYKDFDGMAMKTMLRQLISKWGIMSIDLQRAYTADMAVINEVSRNSVESTYVDVQDEISKNANAEEIGFDDVINAPGEPAAAPTDDGLGNFAETPGF